ncbi:hypothetical protein DF268_06645 [Streptomyces sp. V2]|nr:hypothetical protein DF268_06645 [Streptomyces sp. V2]
MNPCRAASEKASWSLDRVGVHALAEGGNRITAIESWWPGEGRGSRTRVLRKHGVEGGFVRFVDSAARFSWVRCSGTSRSPGRSEAGYGGLVHGEPGRPAGRGDDGPRDRRGAGGVRSASGGLP